MLLVGPLLLTIISHCIVAGCRSKLTVGQDSSFTLVVPVSPRPRLSLNQVRRGTRVQKNRLFAATGTAPEQLQSEADDSGLVAVGDHPNHSAADGRLQPRPRMARRVHVSCHDLQFF